MNLHDPKTRKRVLLGGAGLGLVVAFLAARRNAGATAQTATVGATTDPSASDPLAGFGTTNGIPAALGGDPGTATAAVDPGTITDAVSAGVASGLGGIDWAAIFQNVITPPPPVVPPGDVTPPPTAPATPPPAKTASGVWWGGKFLTSIGQVAAYERAHGNSGFDANRWAAQHPDAARTLGLTPPPPVPAARPSVSAPVNTPPVSGVARTTTAPPPVAPAPKVKKGGGRVVAV